MRYFSFLIFLMASFASQNLFAELAPEVSVLIFGGDNAWQAQETVLKANQVGRYSSNVPGPILTAGTCGDLMSNFQARALDKMFGDGYISQEFKKEFSDLQAAGAKPRQLILVTLYNDLDEDQIRTYFPEGVPEKRILKRPARDPVTKKMITRVYRGSIYAVKGFEVLPSGTKSFKTSPLPVAFELEKEMPSGLSRKINWGDLIPIEIGRAHREKGALSGNNQTAFHILSNVLSSQMDTLQVDPSKVVLLAHLLDGQHAQLFMYQFPGRLMTPELQPQLETDPAKLLSNYMNIPIPRLRKGRANLLIFGTLANVQQEFPIEQLSQMVHDIRTQSGGAISTSDALKFFKESQSISREDYDYINPIYQVRAPLIVRDTGTAFLQGRVLRLLRQYKWDFKYNNVMEFYVALNKYQGSSDPDFLLETWLEPSMFVPVSPRAMETLKPEDMPPAITVSNLDKKLAEQYPISYLASVLMAVEDMFKARIENSTSTYQELLNMTNQYRAIRRMPRLSSLDVQGFFSTFPLMMVSKDQGIMNQLRILGGQPFEGMAFTVEAPPSGPMTLEKLANINYGLQLKPAEFYQFGTSQLAEIRERLPQDKNTLQRGYHPTRIRLLQSTYH